MDKFSQLFRRIIAKNAKDQTRALHLSLKWIGIVSIGSLMAVTWLSLRNRPEYKYRVFL